MTSGEIRNAGGLSPAQLDTLRHLLERMRADLQARVERDQAAERTAEQEIEPMDAAEQTREQDDAALFAERDRAHLAEVERALRDMEAGRYGISEVSGEPIAFERLLAVPWARRDSSE
jgi:DnaK suppressor protein